MWEIKSHVTGKASHKVHRKTDAKNVRNNRKGSCLHGSAAVTHLYRCLYHNESHTERLRHKQVYFLWCKAWHETSWWTNGCMRYARAQRYLIIVKMAVRMQLTRCLYQMLTRSNSAHLGFLCTNASQNSDSSCLAHKLHPWRHHNLIPHTSDTNCKLAYLSHLPNNRVGLFPHWQKHCNNDNYVAMRGQTMSPIIGCLCKACDGLIWYFIHPARVWQYQMARRIGSICCKKMSSFAV